jgi:four helix bundle protein
VADRVQELTAGPVATRNPALVGALQRSAAAIGDFLADGAARPARARLGRQIAAALGALAECEAHLSLLLDIRAIDLRRGYATADRLLQLRRQLLALHRKVTAPLVLP